MDKIKQLIMYCMLTLASCTQTAGFDSDYDIQFIYTPHMTIDFNTGILKMDFHDLKFTNTLSLSKDERMQIIKSFNDNEVFKVRGDYHYYSKKIIETPMSNFIIKVYYEGKLQSEIAIDDKITIDDALKGQEYRIVCFRDVIMRILKNQKEFKEAQKKFLKYLDDNMFLMPGS